MIDATNIGMGRGDQDDNPDRDNPGYVAAEQSAPATEPDDFRPPFMAPGADVPDLEIHPAKLVPIGPEPAWEFTQSFADPGPVPLTVIEPYRPLMQTIPARTWVRVLLPIDATEQGAKLWVFNDGDQTTTIPIRDDGAVGLPGGEGIRWLVKTGSRPF